MHKYTINHETLLLKQKGTPTSIYINPSRRVAFAVVTMLPFADPEAIFLSYTAHIIDCQVSISYITYLNF